MARPNNFELLKPEEWGVIIKWIEKKHPELTVSVLEGIIFNGATGEYDKIQPAINSYTIFSWIKKYLDGESERKKEAELIEFFSKKRLLINPDGSPDIDPNTGQQKWIIE